MNSPVTRFSNRPSAFSLVELLVVIAIIGILGAITLSIFSGGSQNAINLTGAGNTVSGVAALARQAATTQRTRTVLVVAEVNDNGTPRSAVSIWDAQTTNQIEKWILLPVAVRATNTSADSDATTNFACSYRGQNLIGVGYPFTPGGQMGDANRVPRLRLQPRQGDASNFFELVFSPVTGTAKTVRP